MKSLYNKPEKGIRYRFAFNENKFLQFFNNVIFEGKEPGINSKTKTLKLSPHHTNK